MATTKTTGAKPTAGTRQGNRTKSQWTRDLLDEGKTVAEITKIIPHMGYAFAYGIAKRAGKADTAANRRPTRTVSIADGKVTINTLAGVRIVDLTTGKMTSKKVTAK